MKNHCLDMVHFENGHRKTKSICFGIVFYVAEFLLQSTYDLNLKLSRLYCFFCSSAYYPTRTKKQTPGFLFNIKTTNKNQLFEKFIASTD